MDQSFIKVKAECLLLLILDSLLGRKVVELSWLRGSDIWILFYCHSLGFSSGRTVVHLMSILVLDSLRSLNFTLQVDGHIDVDIGICILSIHWLIRQNISHSLHIFSPYLRLTCQIRSNIFTIFLFALD